MNPIPARRADLQLRVDYLVEHGDRSRAVFLLLNPRPQIARRGLLITRSRLA